MKLTPKMELSKSTINSRSGSSSSATNDDLHPSNYEFDFGFAFNDSNFSDRILRVKIFPNLPHAKSNGDDSTTISDWVKHRKHGLYDIKKESGADVILRPDEIVNCIMLDSNGVAYESLDRKATVAMIEESPCVDGDETLQSSDSSLSMNCLVVSVVKTIHISSPIVAAKSPFFYKLFSNGMKESEQRHVTLRIYANEEDALMDLLHYMYSNTLQTSTQAGLLDVLLTADKYEVASCMRYCSRMLFNFPMNTETALLYLDLPSCVLMPDTVKPLADAAKEFLALQYKDMTKFREEVMNLPLAGIEAVLASDGLQVTSEDAVFDFAVKWAKTHYPKLDKRRKVLSTLCRLIRFPHMTCWKLRKVLMCNDLDSKFSYKLVSDALLFKSEPPYRQQARLKDETKNLNHRFVERAYKYRPVKVIEFEHPRPQSIVYLDLKKEECDNLFPSGWVYSQDFHLGAQEFSLSAHCNMDDESSSHYFGLFLGMQEKGSESITVDYEFTARQKPTDGFVLIYRGIHTFTGGMAIGYPMLVDTQWTSFLAEDSQFFINGVLHLKAELTVI